MRFLKIISAIFIIGLSIQSSCDKPPFVERVWRFWVENNSEADINFSVSMMYPDTLLPVSEPHIASVRNSGGKTPYDSKNPWSEVFRNLPADTLTIFIYSRETIIEYNWEEIQSNYKIIKRYDLSYQDLESANWTITYP